MTYKIKTHCCPMLKKQTNKVYSELKRKKITISLSGLVNMPNNLHFTACHSFCLSVNL